MKLYKLLNFNEVFTYTDQPVTCPDCGNRTKIVIDLPHSPNQTQVHICLTSICNKKFITQNDDV